MATVAFEEFALRFARHHLIETTSFLNMTSETAGKCIEFVSYNILPFAFPTFLLLEVIKSGLQCLVNYYDRFCSSFVY